mgnify:CR=1 FL=1
MKIKVGDKLPSSELLYLDQNNDVKKYIEINDSILQDYDAVIATGNDLSANQFKKYFDKVPNIIRNSRFSVGLLNGDESDKDLKKLSFDIFMYYGLGCRLSLIHI